MKIKERIRPVLKVIRIIVGCIIALLAGLLAGACAFCAFVVLFSALKPNAPGEQSGFFLLCFVLFAILFYAMVWGRGIKNGSTGKNQAKPVVQRVPKPDCPQPSEDQRQLWEVDGQIDHVVCILQANSMTPGRGAYEAQLAALEQEKQIRLRRMAKHMENVTVQDAWKTFTPEQQKRFDAQVYQYSQDVGRDGVLPREVYAKNRGLVFVDGRPVPKEVAARLKELQEAAATEKERKKNMTLQPMDYPVPFTELLIYPNRITNRPKTAQVLHAEEGASHGGRFKETVCLHEENGRTVLVCDKQRRDEHGPQGDSEWSMRAKLSLVPQSIHYIPLTKWALSQPWWANLRKYTDEVWVRLSPDAPVQYEFHRYRQIKESRMRTGHNQPGWNCTYDEIGLGIDSGVWHLYRVSLWREAPSGLPYHVAIVMKLLPGVVKESEETLCGLMDSLPWWNPDKADRLMWNARNWLDEDWLHRQAELNDSMHRKNPRNDAYEKALDEVLKQLSLLEGK